LDLNRISAERACKFVARCTNFRLRLHCPEHYHPRIMRQRQYTRAFGSIYCTSFDIV
jgi:hypothetical protein